MEEEIKRKVRAVVHIAAGMGQETPHMTEENFGPLLDDLADQYSEGILLTIENKKKSNEPPTRPEPNPPTQIGGWR